MVTSFRKPRCSPIGVDIGSHSVKLVQLNAEGTALVESARWELPPHGSSPEERDAAVVEALRQAREGRAFRGRRAVFCLASRDLFVQNIRVPQAAGDDLTRTVLIEAAGRLPFRSDEAEIRYIEAADVRQGDSIRREVIVLATHRPVIDRLVHLIEQSGLTAEAIDVESAAILRCYARQYRREDDSQTRAMFVHVGGASTSVVTARGGDAILIKHLDIGGRQLDEAVARHLEMDLAEAAALRRHNGDRRADQRDPEIARGVLEAVRPILERLAGELSMCIRYHSVTFRGQPLARLVLSGGEPNETIAQWLAQRLDVRCEIGDPLRNFPGATVAGRPGQWDVATGLALREVR